MKKQIVDSVPERDQQFFYLLMRADVKSHPSQLCVEVRSRTVQIIDKSVRKQNICRPVPFPDFGIRISNKQIATKIHRSKKENADQLTLNFHNMHADNLHRFNENV